MIHCEHCGATFANKDALEIHFGIGAPAFHKCHDAGEMQADGMTQDSAGVWTINDNLLMHITAYNRVALKSNIADPEKWEPGGRVSINRDRQPDRSDSSESTRWNPEAN
jgi:hypothetical protein